jgi:hypothetical protein
MNKNNTSGFKGVTATKDGDFKAFIRHSGKKLYLGRFATASEAHSAYAEKAEELNGAFARAA